ncbi:Kinesin light chain [Seminavis robusta]|uniref:Kinesin light chain n=1 Tax=Seminavis robusta TaxID=568900 RepID=A0A9N8EVM1_9STRA|nr:Kinesin light chain [Seminavis robusta]|eukprot:Sro1817_g299550.1 Kinesin light chain (558) ;mRNA; r:16841-18514
MSKIYEIEDLQGPPGVIRKKGAMTECPIDGHIGAAYVHCLEGEDHVGEATHMLSYSWNYSIGDIVDTLTDYCQQNQLDPKRTYIWICCLCVNQHRVVESTATGNSGLVGSSSQVDFFAIFGERVKRIGHVLAMMAPWKAPIYITRVWCIFEIFTAHTTEGCKVDIVMPPKEKKSLEKDVITKGRGIEALYETLSRTKVEHAKASVESDRLAILTKLESGIGYSILNNQVNNLLRGWMHGVLTQLVEAHKETNDKAYVVFCNRIGVILWKNGQDDAAMKLHQAALTICATVLGQNHRLTAATYNNIGAILTSKGDYEGALLNYGDALLIEQSVLQKNHLFVASTHNNIGYVLYEMGDYEGALSQYIRALSIRLSVLRKNHPAVASSYNNIGLVMMKLGNYGGALSKCTEALAIQVAAGGKHHPVVATFHDNIGAVLQEMGDYEGALSKYKEALAIKLSLLGWNHPDVATTYNSIGGVLLAMGDIDGSLENFKKAFAIFSSLLGKNHPHVAITYHNIGSALKEKGDYDGALSKYKEALVIDLSVHGKNHPSATTTTILV